MFNVICDASSEYILPLLTKKSTRNILAQRAKVIKIRKKSKFLKGPQAAFGKWVMREFLLESLNFYHKRKFESCILRKNDLSNFYLQPLRHFLEKIFFGHLSYLVLFLGPFLKKKKPV